MMNNAGDNNKSLYKYPYFGVEHSQTECQQNKL